MITNLARTVTVGFSLVIAAAAIILVGFFLVAPNTFADSYEDVDIVTVNTAIGTFLILSGLALSVIGYLFEVVLKDKAATVESKTEALDIAKALKALTDLLKQAGGLGIAVMLIGLVLLTGTALSDSSDSTPDTEANAAAAEAGE